jgi:molecular chaperone DnaK (HSP70)
MAYAIDFGTSNTVITRWNEVTQSPETLALPGASTIGSLVPSLLYVQDAAQGEVLIGQLVRDRGYDRAADQRFFRNFKRGIGSNVQGFLPELDGQTITFEQVGSWFLRSIIQQLQTIEPDSRQSLTLTVPVDSFEAYRVWLGRVASSLDIQQVRLLDEPTAAALGYGLADREVLLVIDFGGGTLDFSLVRLNSGIKEPQKQRGFLLRWGGQATPAPIQTPNIAKVLAKAGLNLGGADLDNWILQYLVETRGLTVSPLTLRLCERLKIQLSTQTQAEEVYFNDQTLDSLDLRLTRTEFEAILTQQQFFAKLDSAMQQVLQQAQRQGLTVADIDAVLLVGGTSQIPAFQTWVNQYFAADRVRSDKPFEAIAQGALQISQNIQVEDFLYHGYGIRYWDRRINAHNWHPIVPAGQAYPMVNPIEMTLGASIANQPKIELVVGELGVTTEQTEVYFDGAQLITRRLTEAMPIVQALNDSDNARGIAELDPLGNPGSDRIKVQFTVNQHRFLCITVEDLLTKRVMLEDEPVVKLA